MCNHPELFEQQTERLPLHFAATPNPLLPPPFGQLPKVGVTGDTSEVTLQLPKLVYREGLPCLGASHSGALDCGSGPRWLQHRLNVFEPSNVHISLFGEHAASSTASSSSAVGGSSSSSGSAFGFSRLAGLSPGDLAAIAAGDALQRWEVAVAAGRRRVRDVWRVWEERWHDYEDADDEARRASNALASTSGTGE